MRIPYEDVVELVRTWPSPTGYGPAVAQRWNVPLKTAQRWIYQARLRGLLSDGDEPRPCPTCNGTGVTSWGNRWKKTDAA